MNRIVAHIGWALPCLTVWLEFFPASVSMFLIVSCFEAAPLALGIYLYLFVSMDARLQNLDQHSYKP